MPLLFRETASVVCRLGNFVLEACSESSAAMTVFLQSGWTGGVVLKTQDKSSSIICVVTRRKPPDVCDTIYTTLVSVDETTESTILCLLHGLFSPELTGTPARRSVKPHFESEMWVAIDVGIRCAAHISGDAIVATRSILPTHWEIRFERHPSVIISYKATQVTAFVEGQLIVATEYSRGMRLLGAGGKQKMLWSKNTHFDDLAHVLFRTVRNVLIQQRVS